MLKPEYHYSSVTYNRECVPFVLVTISSSVPFFNDNYSKYNTTDATSGPGTTHIYPSGAPKFNKDFSLIRLFNL